MELQTHAHLPKQLSQHGSCAESNIRTQKWNTALAKYQKQGFFAETLSMMKQLQQAQVRPDVTTFALLLRACSAMAAFWQGRQIHCYVTKAGLLRDRFLSNTLLHFYAGCSLLHDAQKLLQIMPSPNEVSYAVILDACARLDCSEVFRVYNHMRNAGVRANEFIFTSILSAFRDAGALSQGRQIHGVVVKFGIECFESVGNSLISMYGRCGVLQDAQQVFDEMPSRGIRAWSAIISGNVVSRDYCKAMEVFKQGIFAGTIPNEFGYGSVLRACEELGALKQGMEVHAHLLRTGSDHDKVVLGCLLSVYLHCGDVQTAERVFARMSEKDTIIWTSMISGLTCNDHCEDALKLFCGMLQSSERPNEFTFSSVLQACACLAVMDTGRQWHVQAIKTGFDGHLFVGSALVDMYWKCGSLDDSWAFFQGLSHKNSVSWTAMIMGFAQHGLGRKALVLFEQMLREGFRPSHVTFLAVLCACNSAGLVSEALEFFKSMTSDYGISPALSHYVCMVDILGRSGRILEAEKFIRNMPEKPTAIVWQALLGACKIHGNTDVGERAVTQLIQLEYEDHATQLAHLCGKSVWWTDSANMRDVTRTKELVKEPGYSWIEINSKVHVFFCKERTL